jgi:hypothetical protein
LGNLSTLTHSAAIPAKGWRLMPVGPQRRGSGATPTGHSAKEDDVASAIQPQVLTAPKPAAANAALLNSLALAVWITGFANVVIGGSATRVGIAVIGFYLLVSLPAVSRASILPIVLATIGVGRLCLIERDFEPLWQGLSFGLTLGAFLGSVLLLRSTLTATLSLARAASRFAALPAVDRRGASAFVAFVVGCVFNVATFTLLGPLLEDQPDRERRQLAPVMLCGMCLSLLWSPFSVGMAFAAKVVPHAQIIQGIGFGAGLSVIGLLVALGLYSHFRFSVLHAAASVLAPAVAPIAALLIAVGATCWATRLRVTEAIVVAAPAFCVIYLLIRNPSAVVPTIRATCARAGHTLSDLLLYVSNLAFARALVESSWPQAVAETVSEVGLSAVVLPGLAALAPVFALSGLHASILAGVVAAIGLSLPAHHPARAIFSVVLLTWTAATLLSFSSVNVAIASREFRVGIGRLIFSRNLAVMTTIGVIAAGWIAWLA